MEIKKIFLVLVDISGYTKFIKLHKTSLIHAERIISELLESIIKESAHPLIPHELEGDAISFYAISNGSREVAQDICKQVERFFERFQEKESELVSDCAFCKCEACANVRQLKLKAILHYGEAVFAKVQHFQKVAGEDVILAHRLLKNSIEQDEYILLTDAFYNVSGGLKFQEPQQRNEYCEGMGKVNVLVYYPKSGLSNDVSVIRSRWDKFKMLMKLEVYLLKRLFVKPSKSYHNLKYSKN